MGRVSDLPLASRAQEALGRRAQHAARQVAPKGAGFMTARQRTPTGSCVNGASNRCDRLAWKMSPA
jgi:hypothetical protein